MIAIRRSLALAAIVVLAQAVPVLAQESAPPGSIGIRLLEAPVAFQHDPRARVFIIDHLAQGEAIHRRIGVSSGLDHPERLSLYAAGAAISGGRFRFLDGHAQNELSGWITVDPSTVDLAPHGSATAEVTIAVPPGAADGERYSVVWAESAPSRPPSGGLTRINRVGIRVYLSVGSGNVPPTDFRIESLTAMQDRAGRRFVSATVFNSGGRAIDVTGRLRLTDGPGGISAGPFDVQSGTTIGIGQREPVRVQLDPQLPRGPWRAALVLSSGLVRRRAEATITFPARAGARSSPVSSDSGGGVWWLILVTVVVLAGGWWFLLLVRRRRRQGERGGAHRVGALHRR
ncbi:MAG: peptidase [Actinomycetota bacterium]